MTIYKGRHYDAPLQNIKEEIIVKFNIALPESMAGYKLRHLYPMETKRYTVETEINNVASIVDAMIRVTAKLTDMYAGDIFYPIKQLYEAINKKASYCILLAFYESGIAPMKAGYDTCGLPCAQVYEGWQGANEAIQFWLLSYEPMSENRAQCRFERVQLSREDE